MFPPFPPGVAGGFRDERQLAGSRQKSSTKQTQCRQGAEPHIKTQGGCQGAPAGKKTGPQAPRHVSRSKVKHHRRPAVHRRAVQHTRSRASRTVRQPVKRIVVRTVHRYPVHRVQRRFVRRPYYVGRHSHHRRYTHSYYPGRYVWRTSHYNRGRVASRRFTTRVIGGTVESVQGNANNGTLLVKVLRRAPAVFVTRGTGRPPVGGRLPCTVSTSTRARATRS